MGDERPDIILYCQPCEKGGKGFKPWFGGAALAAWICRQPHYFTGQDVLELGAGATALPSQCLALCGAAPRSIRASDSDCESLQTLRMNLALNGLEDHVGARNIVWQEASNSACNDENASIIVFAQCVYEESASS